jgi:hypothetical protein
VSAAITRAALVMFVAEGIAHQNASFHPFTPKETEKLREVARTAPRVAWGMAQSADGCGCPLTQAGMAVGSKNSFFWMTFDNAMQAKYGWPEKDGDRVLEVTDA